MSFWNLIGLANKKDIDDLKEQMIEMKNIVCNLEGKLNEALNQKFKLIDSRLENLDFQIVQLMDSTLKMENLNSVENEIKGSIKDLISFIDELKKQSYDNINENHNDIINSFKDYEKSYSQKIADMKKTISKIKSALDDKKYLNEIGIVVSENKAQINKINDEIITVEKMLRALWVNDIADSLEKNVESKK